MKTRHLITRLARRWRWRNIASVGELARFEADRLARRNRVETAVVRLVPGDRTALDDRLRDLDENLRVGNRALAPHAFDQLAAAARRSARMLRGTPAVPAEGTEPSAGVAAVVVPPRRDLRRADVGFTDGFEAASRWALRRKGAARLRQMRRPTTTTRTDEARPAGPEAGAR